VLVEDESVARFEREEAPDNDGVAVAEEIHAPDYVMIDFGFPEAKGG
jgi:hypothetical protein